MPDPRDLEVEAKVRFMSLPEEWEAPEYAVLAEDVAFMNAPGACSLPEGAGTRVGGAVAEYDDSLYSPAASVRTKKGHDQCPR